MMVNSSFTYEAPEADKNIRVNNFYSVCVDNFFKNPNKIREWGLSLPKKPDADGRWPGVRTSSLHEIDYPFANQLALKVLSSYFDFRYNSISWEKNNSYFQEISPYEDNKNAIKNQGWIHQDNDSEFAFLIYLTPNADVNSGTSLFNLKEEERTKYALNLRQYAKESFFKGEKINEEEYNKLYLEHHNKFIEKTRFSNIYNRMIAYDGVEFHKANNFVTNAETRLTIVGFMSGIVVDEMPLKRVKNENNHDIILEKRING